MRLNPITNLNFSQFQYYLSNIDYGVPLGEPVAQTAAYVGYLQAARNAGIVEDLPERLAEGDLMNAPFGSAEQYAELITLGREAHEHIKAAEEPDLGE